MSGKTGKEGVIGSLLTNQSSVIDKLRTRIEELYRRTALVRLQGEDKAKQEPGKTEEAVSEFAGRIKSHSNEIKKILEVVDKIVEELQI